MNNKLSIIISFLFLFSCSKEEGIGGTSSITGKLIAIEGELYNFNQSFDTTAIYNAADKDIYIIYGENSNQVYDDNFETSWNGKYKFEFLRKGTYTLFTYSKCDTCLSKEIPIFWQVNITENNKSYSVEDKYIFD